MDFLEIFKHIQIDSELWSSCRTEVLEVIASKAFVAGLLIASFCIFAAFAAKKARAIGIISGIASFFSCITATLYIDGFHSIPLVTYFSGSNSSIDAQIRDFLFDKAIPSLLKTSVFSFFLILSFAFTLVLCISLMKRNKKVFGILALIVAIYNYLCTNPIPMVKAIINGEMTPEMQIDKMGSYFLLMGIPAFLLAVGSLITLITRREPKNDEIEGEATEVETAPEAIEAPVRETEN